MQPTESATFGSRKPSTFSDVLGVLDVGKYLFLKVYMLDRASFGCVCREWATFARAFWNVGKGEAAEVYAIERLRYLSGGGVAKVVAWIYPRLNQERFCALALGSHRLEWLTIERGLLPQSVVDTVQLMQATILIDEDEDDDGRSEGPLQGLCSFAMSKKNTFCVVILHGKAMLLKITRKDQPLGTTAYDESFPKATSAVALDPVNNNIIAFGVIVPTIDVTTQGDRSVPLRAEHNHMLRVMGPNASGTGVTTVQTLVTRHRQPIRWLDYSLRPNTPYLQLLSCSSDHIALWRRESTMAETFETVPQCEFHQPRGVDLLLALPHPTWEYALFATNEALEVRRIPTPSENDASKALNLRWRFDGMQVTAATFVAKGNMLSVSDRGDRLLLLISHGLLPVKMFYFSWLNPDPKATRVAAIVECPDRISSAPTGVMRLIVASSHGDMIALVV
tara:strand:- start:3928 stop:5274 length:1347 start_codon:yes stop_codon:yes gene_type:complete